MPQTLKYRTGGGGLGYMMAIPAGIEVRSSAGKLADDLDIKGVALLRHPAAIGVGQGRVRHDRRPVPGRAAPHLGSRLVR